MVVGWVKEAWATIPKEMIRKSFIKTSISSALDGTDDHLFAEGAEGAAEGAEAEEDQTDDEDDLDWATDARYTEEWRELFGESGDEEDFDGF
jgi:hypothetical protein